VNLKLTKSPEGPAPKKPATPIIEAAAEPERQRAPGTTIAAMSADEDLLAASNDTFWFVRRSKTDIGSFASPKDYNNAAGANFSWGNDRIASNEVWSAQGIVGASFGYSAEVQRDAPYIDTLTLAPYVNFDRVSNSTKITEDIDNLTYGGVFELGLANVFGATQYIDLGGELVTSFGGEAKNWSVNLAWQPVGLLNSEGGNTIFSFFGGPLKLSQEPSLIFSISPSVQAEYVSDLSDGELQPIFLDKNEAFRTGPTVVLTIDGFKVDRVPWWIQRIHYQVSYGWLYDWLSDRDYELFDTSLTFALDSKEHLGLTFGYRKGELGETGQDVDLASIALSYSY
jgi:hypothetical protein